MKTAISVPDETFNHAENLAKRLKVSRSELYVKALEHYLKLHDDEALTENFNKVYENIDSRIDPALRSAVRKTFERNEW
jgi:metal-responsive CopG/Arc/MetJ family transcriptional regulator